MEGAIPAQNCITRGVRIPALASVGKRVKPGEVTEADANPNPPLRATHKLFCSFRLTGAKGWVSPALIGKRTGIGMKDCGGNVIKEMWKRVAKVGRL